jgi:hypothetical protein
VELPDGACTTAHVVWHPLSDTRLRVVCLPAPEQLVRWCRREGVREAIVGGFFTRPEGHPLGELRIFGRAVAHVPFVEPWDRARACVHVGARAVRIGRRDSLGVRPRGDLLQAGPLLVERGSVVSGHGDPEGFTAGAHQFDSDITAGRHPRAALAITSEHVLAVACDGRSPQEAGMTLDELAHFLVALGARGAMNLDGGGSASLVSAGRLRNRPREEHGIDVLGGRRISSALVFTAAG